VKRHECRAPSKTAELLESAVADEDLAWLHATLAREQLTLLAQGGHLGNLFNPAVQKTILAALSGLKSSTDHSP